MKRSSANAVHSGIQSSEERFRLLVESVQDYAMFMLDTDGRVVSWNAGAERIKGYTADDIIGEHFSRFYPMDAIARRWPEHELEVAAREGRFEDEGWRIRKDGTRFWALVVITALRDEDGTLLGFSKITRDLTERKKSEEALQRSEERFRLLVEGVRDYAIFMLDPRGIVASWNAGAERIKGYDASEIIGQHFSRFYPPDAVARGWPEHELSRALRDGRFEDEGWRLRRDGSRFWANVVITPVHDATGTLRGFAKITRDLTERRRVFALEEEGRRINEFLAMLGHELRNPLGPIRNAVTLLGAPSASPERAAWARNVIERQVTHLARIVDDLLDLGRVNAGKIAVRRDRIDLGAVVDVLVDTARSMFEDKRQKLEVSIPAAPILIRGDETRLAQVILNLLTNANKYTPAGGRVEILVEQEGRFAQLRVRDDGVGISPDLLPRVFEPFMQGDRTLDRSEGGLGIGLALVRKVVELHQGTVSASSGGIRRGSEFVIRLPLAPDEARSSEPALEAPTAARRVLVVDDQADAAESLALLLDVWGHVVRTASDGPTALAAVVEFRPDLVLLDIGLPGMDGYAVAEHLRDDPARVVALTGYGQREDAERARRAGFDDHLVKPVEPSRLERLLAELPPRARS